jgi:hypothetical protein
MNIFRTCKKTLRVCIGVAGVTLLVGASALAAQDDKTPPKKLPVAPPKAVAKPSTAKPTTPAHPSTAPSKGPTAGPESTGKTGTGTPTSNMRPGLTKGANGKPETFKGRTGSEAKFDRSGKIREVHARGMTITHGPAGSRRIVAERPDHSRIVVNGRGHGFVERPFLYRGHPFVSRAYFYNGRPYSAYYWGYPYRGVYLAGYMPYYYYRPAFYGWAYNPWISPVRYGWGWAGSPWYGYYGYYFTPYGVYPSASYWLTDYMISSSLQQAYQEQLDAQGNVVAGSAFAGGPVVLTPAVKQAIANEVQGQLALENQEAQTEAQGGDVDINSSGLPRILQDTSPSNPHVFVVAGPLNVTDGSGQDCGLTEGDVLQITNAPGPGDTSASLQVLASKNQECGRGTTVVVGFADLQEMQNHMRASIDQGLADLQAHEGGLPAPPPSASAPPVQAPFAAVAPPADPNVSSELQQQAQAGDAADQEVAGEVAQAQANTGTGTDNSGAEPQQAPIEITLGMTTDDVKGALGAPKQVVNLGAKQIYVYADMKITFVNGKVTDVQ